MSRALVSFSSGAGFTELFELSRPGMERYADRHGYTVFPELVNPILGPAAAFERPPSWWKVPLLLAALDTHEEALWIDCDTVVVDDSQDLADELHPDAWQAITRHFTSEGEVPSCGVWYVRRPMRPVLEQLWQMVDYTEHPWWEQAALHELLGYGGRPVELVEPTGLYDRTHWFGEEWNRLCFDVPAGDETPPPRILHVRPGWPAHARADLMRVLVDERVPLTKGA